jgi:hypothetical protein
MAPQPLSKIRKPVGVDLSTGKVLERPELAAIAMGTIATWSNIDNGFAQMTSVFLQADFEAVTAMLAALTSSEARYAAIRAAAESALNDDDWRLFQAVDRAIKPSRKRRNEYAHHVWGISPTIPDALLLVNPRYLAKFNAELDASLLKRARQPDLKAPLTHPELDFSQIFVYRKRDLERDAKAAIEASNLVLLLRFSITGARLLPHPAADRTRLALLSRPAIQQALKQLSQKDEA